MVSKDVVFDEKTYYYNSNKNLNPRDLPYLELLDTSAPNFCLQKATNDQNSSDLSPSTRLSPLPHPNLSISDEISLAPDDSSVPTRTAPVT